MNKMTVKTKVKVMNIINTCKPTYFFYPAVSVVVTETIKATELLNYIISYVLLIYCVNM